MARHPFDALFAHADWANAALFDALERLPGDVLDRGVPVSMGSMREILRHLVWADDLWCTRWEGGGAVPEPPRDLSELRDASGVITERLRARLTDPDYRERIAYTNTPGDSFVHPLGDLVLHLLNHGFHHRAQLVNLLRREGAEAPALDYIFYCLRDPDRPQTAHDIDTAHEWLRYGDWATVAVLDALADAPEDMLDASVPVSIGSVRAILVHLTAAESWWHEVYDGAGLEFPPPTPKSLAEIRATVAATTVARHARAEAGRSDPAYVLTRKGRERTMRLEWGDILLQLGGHGTQHRAQVLNLMRRSGIDPPRLDYVHWIRLGAPDAV